MVTWRLTGKWKCSLCGKVWEGEGLRPDAMEIVPYPTCADPFCGARCYRLSDVSDDFKEVYYRITEKIKHILPDIMMIETNFGGSSYPLAYWLVGPKDVPDVWAQLTISYNTKGVWETLSEGSPPGFSDCDLDDITMQFLPRMLEIVKEELEEIT